MAGAIHEYTPYVPRRTEIYSFVQPRFFRPLAGDLFVLGRGFACAGYRASWALMLPSPRGPNAAQTKHIPAPFPRNSVSWSLVRRPTCWAIAQQLQSLR